MTAPSSNSPRLRHVGSLSVFAGLLIVGVAVAVVMLITDKNLQTNFQSVTPYYIHWYGLLALAVVTLLVAALLLLVARRTSRSGSVGRRDRTLVWAGFAWAVLSVIGVVGILASYQQVGFSLADWAKYLFGVTAYPGTVPGSYIPWLYDVLLGAFVAAMIAGAIAVNHVRTGERTAPPPAEAPG